MAQPGRCSVPGHAGHGLALVACVAAADLGVGEGVGQRKVPLARQAGLHFGLEAVDLHFADLQAVERVAGVGGLAVLFAQGVHSGKRADALARRLPLHTRLPLFTALRLIRGAVRVKPAQGLERFGIAHIRCPAAVHLVRHARAFGPGFVVHGSGRAALGIGLGAVMAQAQRGRPAAPLDLVLRVEAQLLLHHAGLAHQLCRRGRREVAVHRVVHIDGRRHRAPGLLAGVVALHVQAGQQRVRGAARLQLAFELRVDEQHAAGVEVPHRVAYQRAVVAVEHRARRAARGGVGGEAGVDGAVVHLAHGAAQVLAHRPVAVQTVTEQVAPGVVTGVVRIPARLADEGVARNLAVLAGQLRALPREEADERAALVLLVQRLQRERRVGIGLPGERWRKHHAVVVHMVHLRAAVAAHGYQAIEPLAVLVERARQVGGDLLACVVAQLHLHLAQGVGLRALAKSVTTTCPGARKCLAGMGCKARCAVDSSAIHKRRNAADRPARHLPEGLE